MDYRYDTILKILPQYVPIMFRSLGLPANLVKQGEHISPEDVVVHKLWGASRSGFTWEERSNRWYASDVPALDVAGKRILAPKDALKFKNKVGLIPLFPNSIARLLGDIKNESNTGNKDMLKTTTNKVLEQNKVAVKLASKLAVGKTANGFFLDKLAARLPFYAKIFGGKAKVVENPLAKLVTAEVANTLATHFAGGNKKLTYIAEAMLEEAMVDITVNSKMLENLIKELEATIDLPELKLGE